MTRNRLNNPDLTIHYPVLQSRYHNNNSYKKEEKKIKLENKEV